MFVITSSHTTRIARGEPAFTLIEMVAVIAILVTLMTAGVSLLNGTGVQSRKAGMDMLTAMIEQGRTTAITSRSKVLLAIVEPGDLPSGDERCRLGLFKLDEATEIVPDPPELKAVLLNRWQSFNTGLVMLGDDDGKGVAGLVNPMSSKQTTITYGGTKNLKVQVHYIAFNSRGGLIYPTGSSVLLRLAEGNYRGGKATANKHKDEKITENRLKIGRVTARPYRIDG